MRHLRCLLLLTLIYSAATGQKLTWNNAENAYTLQGEIVDAHDGRVVQFGKKFYWYGTQYGATNGFTKANTYVCYSSTNLKQWKYEGPLLAQKPEGVYYRPHVVFNAKTNTYILWYNWYPKLWDGQFGVAESNTPAGPFKIINDNVKVKHSDKGVGDLGVFVDDDAKAYLSYNTIQGHKVSVELLNESYTSSTLLCSDFIAENCEAGAMFKRNGYYYLLTDYTCCFCTQGSGASVFIAKSPLGPFEYRQNINRYPGDYCAQVSDGNFHDNQFATIQHKKQEGLELWTKKVEPIQTMRIYQFTGNRKGQCGEVNNPQLHEPILKQQFTISFLVDGAWKKVTPSTIKIKKQSGLLIYDLLFVAKNEADKIRIVPMLDSANNLLQIAEIVLNNKTGTAAYLLDGKQMGKPIIPAQQTFVMSLQQKNKRSYIWMGDLWGSASDGRKGHDYQFWSKPLEFYKNGTIKSLSFVEKVVIE